MEEKKLVLGNNVYICSFQEGNKRSGVMSFINKGVLNNKFNSFIMSEFTNNGIITTFLGMKSNNSSFIELVDVLSLKVKISEKEGVDQFLIEFIGISERETPYLDKIKEIATSINVVFLSIIKRRGFMLKELNLKFGINIFREVALIGIFTEKNYIVYDQGGKEVNLNSYTALLK